ncbi:MAG TPA: alkaline phosphatase family protein [Acidimicrobiales bacterium]|nr:alkaline phosphatase family protein [Acidimicrobiales bacterium]
MALSRRTFLKTALAGAGATALGGAAHASELVNLALPAPLGGAAPKFPNIQHVVVVMMENRSTDHYLGWWGDREDVRFDASTSHPTRPTFDFGARGEQNWSGHPYIDPGHSHGTGRRQVLDSDGDGVPDGWSVTEDGSDRPGTSTDRYASSFYTDADLPVIARLVEDFTSFDRYFTSWMGSTYPNRYYMHSAQAHGITNNDFPPQRIGENPVWALGWDWPTLWDQLTAAGVTWSYYFSNLPVIALWGPRYLANARPITDYYADCAAGTLPQVTFVDPFFVAPEGVSNDDHPHADIRLGQEFYSDVVTAFLGSPSWHKGAMFINYDEWGGFWDHVTPPAVGTANDPLATYGPSVDYRQEGAWTTDPTPDFGLHGFRTPAFLLSPYARNTGANPAPSAGGPGKGRGRGGKAPEPTRDRTVSDALDHTSILAFIAENWGLPQTSAWQPGFSRTSLGTMRTAFDPSIADPDDPGDPEVDVAAYAYTAPLEARTAALPIPESSVSALWSQADWIESMGYVVNTRFADALPYTR